MDGSIFPQEVNDALDAKVKELGVCRIERDIVNEAHRGCGRDATKFLIFDGERIENGAGRLLALNNLYLAVRRYKCVCGKPWVAAVEIDREGIDLTRANPPENVPQWVRDQNYEQLRSELLGRAARAVETGHKIVGPLELPSAVHYGLIAANHNLGDCSHCDKSAYSMSIEYERVLTVGSSHALTMGPQPEVIERTYKCTCNKQRAVEFKCEPTNREFTRWRRDNYLANLPPAERAKLKEAADRLTERMKEIERGDHNGPLDKNPDATGSPLLQPNLTPEKRAAIINGFKEAYRGTRSPNPFVIRDDTGVTVISAPPEPRASYHADHTVRLEHPESDEPIITGEASGSNDPTDPGAAPSHEAATPSAEAKDKLDGKRGG